MCGMLATAKEVLKELLLHDVVSWNAVIAGYAQYGPEEEAVKLYHGMGEENILPDRVTYLAILLACGSLAALELGKQLHIEILKLGFELEVEMSNTIMNMYAKCGCIDVAFDLFQNSATYNIASWSVIAAAYAQHGFGMEAISLIERMDLSGFKMDHIAFLNKLTACSHSGLIEKGYHVLYSMEQNHAVKPSEEHYACMVDLLGRAGHLNEASDLLRTMSSTPDVIGWRSMLAGCRTFRNTTIANGCFDKTHASY